MTLNSVTNTRNRVTKPQLVSVVRHGKKIWKLKGYYINGKRVRKFFNKKADGEEYIETLSVKKAALGNRAFEVSGWLHEQALKAQEILAPYQATLVEAAEVFVELQKERKSSVSVSTLAELYQAARVSKGSSSRYQADLKSRLGKFMKAFDALLACDITTRQVDRWIMELKLSPVSLNNFRTVLHGMFEYGKKQGYLSKNPVSDVARVKVLNAVPGILAVDEVRRLLLAADVEVQWVIAIGAFAGLRNAELERLTWGDIRLAQGIIHLGTSQTKTAQRRLVTISDNLRSWLRDSEGKSGRVVPANYRKKFIQAAKLAGFGNQATSEEGDPPLKPWPHNALRHSFASYHLAKWQDAGKTAHELGHSTTAVLYQHYRELVTPEAAEQYWDIFPE